MKFIKRILSIFLVTLVVLTASFTLSIKTIASSSTYYDGLESLYGTTLKSSLRSLVTTTHTYKTSYNDCKDPDIVEKTDGDPNNSNNIILFWSGLSVKSTWDGGETWNREHVWPQSQGWFETSGAGADLHHIRPTDKSVNSSHNNNPYGIVSTSDYVKTSTKNGSVITDAKCQGGVFEPGDDKKGDAARIIFYLLVRYTESDSYPITNVATSLDLLLEWNNSDPVDESETRRNEAVADIQGNRNPFIDNSNYANLIWGGAKPDDNTGNGSGIGSGDGTNTGTGTGGTSEVLPTTNLIALFDFGTKDSSKTNENTQDGNSITSYSETDGNYTLTLSNMVKIYGNSYDATGNSCLKLGSSSSIGLFSFTIPDEVNKVVIRVTGYKSNKASISINAEESITISTFSSNGEYTNVIVDTTDIKTISFSTTSSGYRCKIDAIAYYGEMNDETLELEQALNSFVNESTKTSLFLNYNDNLSENSTHTTYSYTFTSKVFTGNTTKSLNSIDWVLTNNGNYYGYESNRGQQIGSGNNPATTVTLTTNEVINNVTNIRVSAAGASSTDAKLEVYVGDNKIGDTKSLTSSSAEYTFESATSLDGYLTIKITQSSKKAIYIKSIAFDYDVVSTENAYTLNYASMRFGTCIDKQIYDTLNDKGAIWGVEYYKGAVTDWESVSGIKITCNPAQVSQIGSTTVDSSGLYYQFALVLTNISYNNLDTEVSARVYVIVDGVTYYMNSTTYSLRNLVTIYLNSSEVDSYSEYIGILQHLRDY